MPTVTVTPSVLATYTFANFIGFIDDLLNEGEINGATANSTSFESTWLDVVFGSLRAEVTGTGFSYAGNLLLNTGTTQTVTAYVNGVLQGTVSGIDTPTSTWVTALQAEATNPLALEQFMLGFDFIYNGTSADDISPTLIGDGYAFNPVGNDVFNLAGGNDNFFSGDGNDFLYGGEGTDTLRGGEGNDMLFGGVGADSLDGGAGLDYARYDEADYGDLRVSLQVPLLNTGAAAGDTFADIEGLILGSGNDWIYGDGASNYLYGGGGNDNIFGSIGADYHHGGSGLDYARFDDAAYGDINVSLAAPSIGTNVAAGDTFVDIEGLILGGGNDWIYGDNGDNYLYGNSGNDNLFGSNGADYIHGGAGFDYARFDDAGYAGLVADLVGANANTGAAAGDTFVEIEGLILTGFGDYGFGNEAGNYIYGLGGDDYLDGRGGTDFLIGGTGNDTFHFMAGYGRDTVSDFNGGTGLGDRLDLQGSFASFSAVLAASTQAGANLEIALNGTDVLVLANFSISNFAQDDVLV